MSSAKQRGMLPMQGAVGEMQFFRDRHGRFRLRQRYEMPKNKIATHPSFKPLREHMSEFSRAIAAGKLIGEALNSITHSVADTGMRNRLSSLLLKVVKSDPVNARGQRIITNGDAAKLRNFEFNALGTLASIVKTKYQGRIDREEGEATITVDSFIPGQLLVAPVDCTHFRLQSAVLDVDFEAEAAMLANKVTPMLPITQEPIPEVKLTSAFAPDSGNLVLLLFGIDFYVYINGVYYPFVGKDRNALKIVEVSQVEAEPVNA